MSAQPPQPGRSSGDAPIAINPYAPTVAVGDGTATDVESYRQKYLSHEVSVRSIGLLYLLGSILLVPMGLLIIISGIFGGSGDQLGVVLGVGGLYLGFGLLQGYTGLGLRKLQPGARIVAIILAIIGLLGIPVGTLISVYFLYILCSAKGTVVFSDEYKNVIRQTPHIRYRTSITVWIFLGLLILVCALGITALLFGAAA